MPKMKSNRTASKRFKITGTGKFMRKKGYARHILSSKSPKRKRNLRGTCVVHKTDAKHVKLMLPYL